MPHQNTVFRQVIKSLPWGVLDRLAAAAGADPGLRRLSTKDQLLAMIFAQLSGAASLRDLEAVLESQSAQRYHAGLPPVHRSTLADANAKRPCAVFVDLFAAMVAGAGHGLRRMVGESVHLIDSTSIRLSAMSDWSRFSATVCGVKAHVVYDADEQRPRCAGAGDCRSLPAPLGDRHRPDMATLRTLPWGTSPGQTSPRAAPAGGATAPAWPEPF